MNKIKRIDVSENSTLTANPVPHLILMFNVFLSNSEKCDELRASNIDWIGQQLLHRIENFEPTPNDANDKLLQIFAIAYRFLLELEFTQVGELSLELRQIKEWTNKELQKFPEDIRQSLIWANYIMPAEIAKKIVHHPSIGLFREFNVMVNSAGHLRDEWTKEIEAKRQVVDRLKQDLDKYESAYNFVGLVDGFKKLLESKHKERKIAFWSLFGIGFLILLSLILEIMFVLANIKSVDSIKNLALLILPSTIAIEIFLFYFFRVVLMHFRTVKAHILQLDLRVSLCQFIQSYAKYAADIKKSDSASLEKFEALVFSGIVSTDEKLPSTLDGIDQLSSLIKSASGK